MAARSQRPGRFGIGKLADKVVFSMDRIRTAAEEIAGAVVDLTVVGGEILYTCEGS